MISVVIPTLNAAARLPATAAALTPAVMAGLIKELIVSDGGSTDATCAIAEGLGARLVQGEAGRGRQLRAGAAAARADWVLFLHADTVLAPDWAEAAERFMNRDGAGSRAAAFRLAFDDERLQAHVVVALARWRAQALKLPYGDQGLLISRTFYDELGGYQALPLMEDLDLVRRIGPKRLEILAPLALTSAEAYRRDGYFRRALRNLGLAAAFLAGADPARLAKRYYG